MLAAVLLMMRDAGLYIDTDCERCGRRRHSFWEDPLGDLLSHLCEKRPWCNRVIAIAHNARGFDAQFILDRAIVLKWTPELILNGQKIICMKIHHVFIFRFDLVYAYGVTQAARSIRTLNQNPGTLICSTLEPTWIMWDRFQTCHNMASPRWASQKERSSRRGTMFGNTKCSITGACWNSTVRMTSPSCDRRVSYSEGILWMSETWIFSLSLTPSRRHV